MQQQQNTIKLKHGQKFNSNSGLIALPPFSGIFSASGINPEIKYPNFIIMQFGRRIKIKHMELKTTFKVKRRPSLASINLAAGIQLIAGIGNNPRRSLFTTTGPNTATSVFLRWSYCTGIRKILTKRFLKFNQSSVRSHISGIRVLKRCVWDNIKFGRWFTFIESLITITFSSPLCCFSICFNLNVLED